MARLQKCYSFNFIKHNEGRNWRFCAERVRFFLVKNANLFIIFKKQPHNLTQPLRHKKEIVVIETPYFTF